MTSPDSRWADVLGRLSASHRGRLASMFTGSPGPELMSHTDWRPLESVVLTRNGGRRAVRITFQGWPEACVDGPRALAVGRARDGAERALEIDAAGGVFVRIRFRATALPDQVDGIAPAELAEPRRRRSSAA